MKRDFYICELAWTPTPDPAAKSCCGAVAPRIISLPPTLPARAFAPKRADPRRSKNARKETRSGCDMALALPAHLGDVVRDLGRFFLQLFPFCGRDRFVSRGD